jgi:hypothetical protein
MNVLLNVIGKRIILVIFYVPLQIICAQTTVTNYQIVSGQIKQGAKDLVALRSLEIDHVPYFLAYDPNVLQCQLLLQQKNKLETLTRVEHDFLNKNSLMNQMQKQNSSVKNQPQLGFKLAFPKGNGIRFILDFCSLPQIWDKEFINGLIDKLLQIEKPLNIAISIPASSLKTHKSDLTFFKDLQKKGVKITWINHGAHAVTQTKNKIAENYLTDPNTDVVQEVLENEQVLIGLGFIPSPLYMIPGSLSDVQNCQEVIDYGLLPVCSDDAFVKARTLFPGQCVFSTLDGTKFMTDIDFFNSIAKDKKQFASNQWMITFLMNAKK